MRRTRRERSALGATNIPYSAVLFENQGRNEAYSVFADATWIPTDSLELTAGIRFLDEYRQSGFFSEIPNSVITGAPLVPGGVDTNGRVLSADDNFQAVLPRFNALYRISNDVNVYATVSKGRRSPVLQLGARRDGASVVANRLDVPEETVWNYEGGIKLASGPVSGSLGVYYQVYEGFQVTVVLPDLTTRTESAGKAANLGVEGELAIDIADWLQVFGNFGYIDGGIEENNTFAPQFSGARFRRKPNGRRQAVSPLTPRSATVCGSLLRPVSRTAAASSSKCLTIRSLHKEP